MLTLRDFEGRWRLTRQIDDARGPDATFTGTAVFSPDSGGRGLELVEQGQLVLQGQGAFQAERRYLWQQDDACVAVFFADGRDFHRFDPQGGQAQAAHWCDPDTYEVQYDFTGWPVWQVQWRVTGPRKDYMMRSVYTRIERADQVGGPQ